VTPYGEPRQAARSAGANGLEGTVNQMEKSSQEGAATDWTIKARGEGESMKHVKRFRPQSRADGALPVRARQFVFFDKKTGTRRFEVKAGEDGNVCLDQAVSMLAVYCAWWHQMPRDFNVMVMAGEEIVGDLMRRATKLLRTCSEARTLSPLSRRQYQVLSAIAKDLSNKEIAAKLSLSESTVKFHVSAMLEKFRVRTRMGLLMKAGDYLGQEAMQPRELAPENATVLRDGATVLSGSTARPSVMIPMARKAGR
jgi:DNA-binding CsgD family transcriptional regulator